MLHFFRNNNPYNILQVLASSYANVDKLVSMMEEYWPSFEDVPVSTCCDICDQHNLKLFLDSKVVQLSETESEVLSYRLDHNTKSLCEIHYQKEVVFFPLNQKYCADPESRHKRKVKVGLVPVSLSLARNCKLFTETRVNPQSKICRNCLHYLTELVETSQSDVNQNTQP